MRPIGSSAFLHSKAIASGNAERNAPSPATSRSTPIGASPPATPANANPVAAPELEAPSAIPSVADVEVALSAKPHNARIFLDGAEVKNPYVAKHRADGGSHSVRAEARGYLAKTVTVVFAQDSVRLGIVLELASVPGARARKYSAPTAASPPDPAPPPSAQPRCDFPFAVDSDGIKHVRPECMP